MSLPSSQSIHIELQGLLRVTTPSEVHLFTYSPYAKIIAFLAIQTLQGKKKIPRVEMAQQLWPEEDLSDVKKHLNRNLHRLKQQFLTSENVLFAEEETLSFREKTTFDLEPLSVWKQSKDIEFHTQTLDRFKGRLLEEFHEEWAQHFREDVQRLQIASLEKVAQHYLQNKEHKEAKKWALRWMQANPFEEKAVEILMNLYISQKEYSSALWYFKNYESLLQNELELSPPENLQKMAESIEKLVQPPPEPKGLKSLWVGRKKERLFFLRKAQELQFGYSSLLFIEGHSGVGKTSFCEKLSQDLLFRNMGVVWGNSQEHTSLSPFSPLTELLEDLLDQQPETFFDSISEQASRVLAPFLPDFFETRKSTQKLNIEHLQNAFQEIFELCFQQQPLVLFFDNVQWADADFWHWMKRLMPLFLEKKSMVVFLYQKKKMIQNAEGWKILCQMDQQFAASIVQIQGFSRKEVEQFLDISKTPFSQDSLDRVYVTTRGYPGFLKEWLHQETTSAVPMDAEKILFHNFQTLAPMTQRIFEACVVMGQSFSHSLVQKLFEQEIFSALSELMQKDYLVEKKQQLHIAHDLQREIILSNMSKKKKRALHFQIAEKADNNEISLNVRAWHYEQSEQWDLSVTYYLSAAEENIRYSAIESAHTALLLAKDLYTKSTLPSSVRWKIYLLLLEVFRLQGVPAEQRLQVSKEVLAYTEKSEQLHEFEQARAFQSIGFIHLQLGERDRAMELYEKAFAVYLQSGKEKERVLLASEMAFVWIAKREPHKALTLILSVFEQAQFFPEYQFHLGLLYSNFFEHKKTIHHYQKALQLLEEKGETETFLYKAIYSNYIGKFQAIEEMGVLFEKGVPHFQSLQKGVFRRVQSVISISLLDACLFCSQGEKAELYFEALLKDKGSKMQGFFYLMQSKKSSLQGDFQKAWEWIQKAPTYTEKSLMTIDNDYLAWFMLDCLIPLQKWEEAQIILEKLQSWYPSQFVPMMDREIGSYQAWFLAAQGKKKEAVEALKFSIEGTLPFQEQLQHLWRMCFVAEECQYKEKKKVFEMGLGRIFSTLSTLRMFPEEAVGYLQGRLVQDIFRWAQEATTFSLVREEVSCGKDLVEDNIVTVFCHTNLPIMENYYQQKQWKKSEIRQEKIMRFLLEAKSQGAECSDKDLAEAFQVSSRTIERDMVLFQEQGVPFLTRGRNRK